MEFEENIGVEEQELAEPVTEEPVETSEEEVGETAVAEQEQEPEIPDSVWAVSRKRAEAEANKKYEHQMAEFDQMFRDLSGDAINPLTGKPVTGAKDYLDAVRETMRRQQFEKATAGMETERVNAVKQLIENETAAMNAKLESIERERVRQEAEADMTRQMAELSAAYPNIKSAEDVVNLPTFGQMSAMVQNGVSLLNAYRAANADVLAEQTNAAAKQAAINRVKGTSHLAPAGQGVGDPDDGLTDEIIESYRLYNPGMSRADIAKYHARYNKK